MWPFKPALASFAALALLPWAAGAALGPRYGGELTVGVVELPDSLDPDLPRGAGQSLLAGLVHETLVGCGPDGVPVPRLARSWASSGGGREWTLRLADGSAFHDGKPMTATDVVRSLRRFLRSGSPAAQRFAETLEGGLAYRTRGSEEVGGLLAVDDSRLTLRLAEAVPLPFAPLSATAAAITSASGAGAGPFAPTAFLPGKSRLFTAFGAHLAGRPYLDQVQLLASPEPQSVEAALQAGRAGLIPRIGNTPRSYLGGTLLLILDPDRPPFDRLPARSAVAATLDSPDLLRLLLAGGEASPSLVLPSLLPPLGLATPSVPAPLGGQVAMAVSREVPHLLSQRIVAYLLEAGLTVTAQAASPRQALAARTPLRLVLMSPEVAEAGLALRELAALTPLVPAAQEALRAAEGEPSLDRRRIHLHRAEAALRSSFALIPLASMPLGYAARPGLHGVALDPRGRLLLEDAWLEP